MCFVFVESLVSFRFSGNGPFFSIGGGDHQSIVDQLLVVEASDLLWFLRPMGC